MPKEFLDYDTFRELSDEIASKKASVSHNARLILQERYLKPDLEGVMETPEQRFASIAVDVASAEMETEGKTIDDVKSLAHKTYDLMAEGKFQFNTPTIINFGRWKKQEGEILQRNQMGSACFVIPIDDSMVNPETRDGIMDASVAQAMIHKHGGGTGYSFQRLRPAGSRIEWDKDTQESSFKWGSSAGMSSGPVSFLEYIFDSNTESIKQGNTRRGANMAVQRIDHPDFIGHMYSKFDIEDHSLEKKVKNHNISLAMTDGFMDAAKKDGYFNLYNPHSEQVLRREDLCDQDTFVKLLEKNKQNPFNKVTTPHMYLSENGRDVVNAYTGQVIGIAANEVMIHARTVLQDVAKLAHGNGEPGVLFMDRINEYNPTPEIGEIESTNPCGEQPLLPWEACNLGSINVAKYVTEDGNLNEQKLKEDVKTAVRSLDNVVSRNDFPLPEITETVKNTRKIGLGYMGIADAMILMGEKYGSESSFNTAENLAKILADTAREASFELAEEKGEFPAIEGSIYDEGSQAREKFLEKDRAMNYDGRPRNAAVTTQAPTGTISRISSCSSGIEPLFSTIMVSNILNNKVVDVSYALQEGLKRHGVISDKALENLDKLQANKDYTIKIDGSAPSHVKEELMVLKAIADNGGSLETDEKTPESIRPYLEKIPQDFKDLFVKSSDLKTEQHLKMQTIFQKYNDSSISKTINMPGHAGIDDILGVYFKAWEDGAKGLTVYRDNSRNFQVLNSTGTKGGLEVMTEEEDRPLLQMSITTEFPVGNPSMATGEYDENSEKVFTTVAYDPSTGKINSCFQSTSYGHSFEIIHLIAENKAYSQILKLCDGDPSKLERQLYNLPKAHHAGEIKQNGSFKNRIENDSTEGALLKTLHVLKFLSEGYRNFEDTNEKYQMIRDDTISLKKIIETKGTVEYKEEEGNPSIFPKDATLAFDPAKYIGDFCPYCGMSYKNESDKRSYVSVIEGCLTYKCCGASKCS